MPAWPGTLPQLPLYDGFTESSPNTILRTQMDAGPPKQRRRYTAGIRPITMTLEMTTAQIAVLDDFVINQLNGGVDTFTWTHPRTGAAVTYRLAGTLPTWAPWSDNGWVVRLALEIMP